MVSWLKRNSVPSSAHEYSMTLPLSSVLQFIIRTLQALQEHIQDCLGIHILTMTAKDKHTKLPNRRKNSGNEKNPTAKCTDRSFSFSLFFFFEQETKHMMRKGRKKKEEEWMHQKCWLFNPEEAVHGFRSKFFQIRIPSTLIAVVAENFLVSAEITDTQLKRRVGVRLNNKV